MEGKGGTDRQRVREFEITYPYVTWHNRWIICNRIASFNTGFETLALVALASARVGVQPPLQLNAAAARGIALP